MARVPKLMETLLGRAKPEPADYDLFEYPTYEAYRDAQEQANRRKIDHVWADEATLGRVADRIRFAYPDRRLFAVCHGTRNGFEQALFSRLLPVEVIGTEISETATDFPMTLRWDFHDENPDWVGRCDFVYSNAWDHSYKPRAALATWLGQVRAGGVVVIEITQPKADRPRGKLSDPFSLRPKMLPFLVAKWFGHQVAVDVEITLKPNLDREAFLFYLKRLSDAPVLSRAAAGEPV